MRTEQFSTKSFASSQEYPPQHVSMVYLKVRKTTTYRELVKELIEILRNHRILE